jgi:hypothetical protein
MSQPRTVSTPLLIGLSFTTGIVIGLLMGRLWAQQVEMETRRTMARLAFTVRRLMNPEQWARDSVARERAFRSFPPTASLEKCAGSSLPRTAS